MTKGVWRRQLGWSGWRRELGWSLMAAGVATPIVFLWLSPGPFIPAQDPTPEMLAQEVHDGRITDSLLAVGCMLGPTVLAVGVWLLVSAKRLDRDTTNL
jgi:hypothetical protein